MNKVFEGVRDFKRGLGILFGKPQAGEGDRKLAKMSKIIVAQIPMYGKNQVRTQVIKSIESDLKKAKKKGGKEAVNAMIDNAISTPEYMELLRKLGMDEPHLRALAIGINRGNK